MDKEKEIVFVKNARKFCAFCKSNADAIAESVDSEFEYFCCKKCSEKWKHPVLTEERIIKKGYLQDQLTKIDALIRDNRELGNTYPNDLALRLNLTSLLNHRNVLCIEIEMVHSPIQFSTDEE